MRGEGRGTNMTLSGKASEPLTSSCMLGGSAARNSGLMELKKLASRCALSKRCSRSCWAITSCRMVSGSAARKVGSILGTAGAGVAPEACKLVVVVGVTSVVVVGVVPGAVVVGGAVVSMELGVSNERMRFDKVGGAGMATEAIPAWACVWVGVALTPPTVVLPGG